MSCGRSPIHDQITKVDVFYTTLLSRRRSSYRILQLFSNILSCRTAVSHDTGCLCHNPSSTFRSLCHTPKCKLHNTSHARVYRRRPSLETGRSERPATTAKRCSHAQLKAATNAHSMTVMYDNKIIII